LGIRIRDSFVTPVPGSGIRNRLILGSGINILDLQQWFFGQFWNCLCSLCRLFPLLWSRLPALARRKPTLFPQLLLHRSVLLCWCLYPNLV
jgi:hypothetical protein